MSYKYYNANPFNRNIFDCAIRTLSVVEDIPWSVAYDRLSDSARDLGLMINSVQSVETYLDRYYKRVPVFEKTVGDFIRNHPFGTYAITMKNHITALKDGINYDTWDSSGRKIWGAWRIEW